MSRRVSDGHHDTGRGQAVRTPKNHAREILTRTEVRCPCIGCRSLTARPASNAGGKIPPSGENQNYHQPRPKACNVLQHRGFGLRGVDAIVHAADAGNFGVRIRQCSVVSRRCNCDGLDRYGIFGYLGLSLEVVGQKRLRQASRRLCFLGMGRGLGDM